MVSFLRCSHKRRAFSPQGKDPGNNQEATMSSLPPYSTYRTDNKQMMYPQAISHGNILTFTPPGFKQTLNVKFPDCRLAVCEKCKKNYKTRDMCRVRNNHTAEPWTTAFICITLDDTCTGEDGKYIDKPLTVRMVQWQPFCVKKYFDKSTPVCSACKKTNRTRSFCRERHRHRQLPWCTVYVLLSALDSADPSTLVAAPSKLAEEGDEKEENGDDPGSSEKASVSPEEKKSDSPAEKQSPDEAKVGEAKEPGDETASQKGDDTMPKMSMSKDKTIEYTDDVGDDINDIAESRTFLAKVSCHASSIHWLELAEFDPTDSGATVAHGLVVPESHLQAALDQQTQYFTSVGYNAVNNHHQALKSHQQYFFQMQQRQQQQQYAAQAAWQAQYNQSGPPADGQAPAALPNAAQPGVPNGHPAVQAPVTAGEAAAQQQKQGQSVAPGVAAVAPPVPQPQHGQAPTAGAAAAAAQQQQQHGNRQWQMMYPQQVYEQQVQQPQQGAPGQQQMPPQAQQHPYAALPQGTAPPHGAIEHPTEAPHGMNGVPEGHDAKRARYA